jgi:ubiquinone/menaquinone biosynthesis C-methylase UbiE
MLRLLLLLRSLVPKFLWNPLWRRFWKKFWRKQQRLANKKSGREVSMPVWGSEAAMLTAEIAYSYRFSSVLEIGCGRGENLSIPSRLFRRAKFFGLSTDVDHVQQGMREFERRKIRNVKLITGEATDLSAFSRDSFDLVFSCASLFRFGPESIEQVLREICRVARKRVVLLEQHEEGACSKRSENGRFELRPWNQKGYWIWDYQALFRRIDPSTVLKISRIPSPAWATEHWRTHGCLITVEFSH